MALCNMSLQILPMVPEEDVYDVVDEVIKLVEASGLEYMVGPMETTIEGELDDLFDLVKKAQEVSIAAGANRVVSIIKIDYRPDGVTMDEKVGKYR